MNETERAIMASVHYWGDDPALISPNGRMRRRWVGDGRTNLERAEDLRGFYLVWDTMTMDEEDRRMNVTGPLMAEVAWRWSRLLIAKVYKKALERGQDAPGATKHTERHGES